MTQQASTTAASVKMPAGVSYIVGNEAAERFSYYGMRTILVIFMTKYLMDASGQLSVMTENESKVWFHTFAMANYFFPIIGALVADIFWGKYRAIISLSFIYCLGHLALALWETRFGLSVGLTLIAIGAGGIKPCVSAHVGDQFDASKKELLSKTFSYFYFAINFGAFFSTMLTPWLLKNHGPNIAFGVPGLLMLLATVVFWMGRHVFIAIPPVGWKAYKADLLSPAGKKALASLPIIYLFIAVFWSLYDQTGSSWVLQAEHLNRQVDLGFWSFEVLPAQVQAINPVLIMAFTPLFVFFVYPFLNRMFRLTYLRKIGIGFVLAAVAFGMTAYVESRLEAGEVMGMIWQIGAYAVITAAEVMVSITALEFSYTQAPNSMKSFVMGMFLLSVSLGNAVTALINVFLQNADGSSKLTGSQYYWFFTILMAAAVVVFGFVTRRYKEEDHLQVASAH